MVAEQGITLTLIVVVAMMIPRIGRFVLYLLNKRMDSSDDSLGKSRMAISGAVLYIVQLIVYFLLFVWFLSTLGFSLTTAAIPATVVSAALGFGAQSLIADFLAGFFIITEKQFGIGDWVRFEGNGVVVEGTVTKLTMRSTQIRTLAEETVIIPNSTAKVCVNSSNYWSRAVVNMPIPLMSGTNLDASLARARNAADRAASDPAISSKLIGELTVQPAVDLTPPSALGTPWTIQVRFLVQVEAGSQAAVERAIRAELLNEFWEEYGSASARDLPTEVVDPPHHPTARGISPLSPAKNSNSIHDVESSREAPTEITAPDKFSAKESGALVTGKDAVESVNTEIMPAAGDTAANGDDHLTQNSEGAESGTTDNDDLPAWRRKLRTVFSAGGRIRTSTGVLTLILMLLLFLRGSTITTGENWDGSDGWLAPRSPETETSEVETSEVTPTRQSATEQQYPTAQQSTPMQSGNGNATNQQQPTNSGVPGNSDGGTAGNATAATTSDNPANSATATNQRGTEPTDSGRDTLSREAPGTTAASPSE